MSTPTASAHPAPAPRLVAPFRMHGMTLIEMMVSMTIGLFLTWGAFEVYVQSKGNYRSAEVMTRLQENTRFAVEMLEPDLRLAGFWGTEIIEPAPPGIAIGCDGADVGGWALNFAEPVAAVDDNYDLPCAANSVAREGSDVLVVRHASENVIDPASGGVKLQVTLQDAQAFTGAVPPDSAGLESQTRGVVVNAYYVDDASSFDDGLPSLRRQTLVNGAVMEDQEIITGVENLQVQFGLDTNFDGTVDRYVDPDGMVADATIVAVRFWMLVRSDDSPGAGFRDERVYQPLDADAAPIVPGADPLYPVEFQRLEVTKTVFLRNLVDRG